MPNKHLRGELKQSCPYGYTAQDIAGAFGDPVAENYFWQWMAGQTMMLCNGQSYAARNQRYEPTTCHDAPHGGIVYAWDLERYLEGPPYYFD